MDENNYYFKRSHVPAFGSWDCNNDDFPIPFTECFESARQAGLYNYSYSQDSDLYVNSYSQDSDLYVTGDLYQNHIVTPTMIVVPRRKKKASYKEARKDAWEMGDCEKESPSPVPLSPPTAKPVPKPVDEDLYKISPDLLYSKSKMKGIRGFISSCLLPTCAC